MNNSLHSSSAKQNWATRWSTFYSIQEELGRNYIIDPCCEVETAKCGLYITKEVDMFNVGRFRDHFKDHPSWDVHPLEEVHCFANPEYAREQVKFVKEFIRQTELDGNLVVDVLIPAKTDTQLFHSIILKHATSIRFVRGRIVFGSDSYWEELWDSPLKEDGTKNSLYGKHGKMNPAAFPSMVVSFGEKLGNGKKQPLNISPLELTRARYPDSILTS